MKKIYSMLIFLFVPFIIFGQFNPPQNLSLVHNYIFPDNFFHLYWETPESGVPELVNYNIYVNWEIYDTVSENILDYTVINAWPADTTIYVYFYITALYENPTGESFPSNIISGVPAYSTDNNYMTSELYSDNYPNPFHSSTTFSFSSKEPIQNAEIKIYNIKGQLVRELRFDASSLSRFHELTWDGKDKYGQKVTPGVYLYQLILDGEHKEERKCLLIE